MAAAKRARTAETPKPPSFYLKLRAPVFYSTDERKTGKLRFDGETSRGFSISDGFEMRCVANRD